MPCVNEAPALPSRESMLHEKTRKSRNDHQMICSSKAQTVCLEVHWREQSQAGAGIREDFLKVVEFEINL